MSREQVRELQSDLERMRNMVEQMQTNIAFISSPQTPMKHQFELEIEMWQLVIDRMERKIKEATGRQ
jgi:predicted RNase H-like nuclease (RuvC/YqgF family)